MPAPTPSPPKRSDHEARDTVGGPAPAAPGAASSEPRASPGPISASATRIQPLSGTESPLEGTVTLVARGAPASRSKSVNQIEPVAFAPGRLWTVWRIQIPRPPSGRQAFR